MDEKRKELLDGCLEARTQSDFITGLCALVRDGSTPDLQEASLMFWRLYPQISLTFARRVILALDRLGVPSQRFEPSLLAVLARCYLRCGKVEQACEYVIAAQRIMPEDAPKALVCQVGELEVTVYLAHSRLEAAQDAWQRLEGHARSAYGDLTCAQLLIGARLSYVSGDLPQAISRAAHALERAVTDDQRCRAQLALLSIEGAADGDTRRELLQLVTLEHVQDMRVRSSLSPLTRAQLSCRLARAFLRRGKLNQAAQRLRRTDTQSADLFCDPGLLAAAIAVARGHRIEARRHLELFDCQSTVGLCQVEYLGRRFRRAMISQMLDGAGQDPDEAEEFSRLCEATRHPLLRLGARLLFASSLIATGERRRALDLLREDDLQTTQHKALRLLRGGLAALCSDKEDAGANPLSSLTDLLSDDDTALVLLFLVRAHPSFIRLLTAEGLEGALSASAQQLIGAGALQQLPAVLMPSADPEEGASGPDPVTILRSAFSEPGTDQALRIQLFGGLQLHRQGQRLELDCSRRNKVHDLIVILALARGREIAREEIIGALWPHQEDAHTLNSFYVVWNALKTVFLADGPKLPIRLCPPERFPFSNAGGRCALLTEYCDLDLDRFDQQAFHLKNAVIRGDDERCFKLADELMATYQGKVLPADPGGEELAQVRLAYQNTFVEMMLLVARHALTDRRSALALPYIERGLTADPSCEELYRLAMHTYALEGRRDDSLRSYYRCRKNLARELGIEPSPELTELFIRLISMSPQADYPAAELIKRLEGADAEEHVAAAA